MIGKLRGIVDESTEDSVILDVNGVGYVVFCSSRTLSALQPGAAATLVIETHVREDHIHLYGFADALEREWFRLLTGVQGVGAKMAQAIQGTFDADGLSRTIGAQDKTGLTRVKGIGPKVAERIVTELKSKVVKMGALPMPTNSGVVEIADAKPAKGKKSAGTTAQPRIMDDAVSALTNLGYTRTDAFTVVAGILQRNPDETPKLDDLIRLGLKELAR
ncbi:MAG: Holliday junction branch migration protein RuvA [Alphaproteobacteria bacterium]|nr:Holliday junction branch migration protein RuvA [Alphaproteobacteria bacterium]